MRAYTYPSRARRMPRRVWVLFFTMLTGVVLIFAWVANHTRIKNPWEGFETPDDIHVAQQALLMQFAGARYFQLEDTVKGIPYPCLSLESARLQAAGVIAARQLPPEAADKIDKLILKLTHPAASRLIGVDFVNVLQLNLTLDQLR